MSTVSLAAVLESLSLRTRGVYDLLRWCHTVPPHLRLKKQYDRRRLHPAHRQLTQPHPALPTRCCLICGALGTTTDECIPCDPDDGAPQGHANNDRSAAMMNTTLSAVGWCTPSSAARLLPRPAELPAGLAPARDLCQNSRATAGAGTSCPAGAARGRGGAPWSGLQAFTPRGVGVSRRLVRRLQVDSD